MKYFSERCKFCHEFPSEDKNGKPFCDCYGQQLLKFVKDISFQDKTNEQIEEMAHSKSLWPLQGWTKKARELLKKIGEFE